jgi:hypothetical protein
MDIKNIHSRASFENFNIFFRLLRHTKIVVFGTINRTSKSEFTDRTCKNFILLLVVTNWIESERFIGLFSRWSYLFPAGLPYLGSFQTAVFHHDCQHK